MTYFDSHAHYDDARFDKDREVLLASLPRRGVGLVLNAGASVASSQASVQLAEAFSWVYAAVGVHPHDVSGLTEDGYSVLEALCGHPKVVAVGEIGLDYYYDNAPRKQQRYWFARQLALAKENHLPVVVHARESAEDTFADIQDSGLRRGVIHCYSGNLPMAQAYIAMGFYLGVGGVITFDKTKKLPSVVAEIPLEHLLIETDAPYQTPVPHRGKRNDSSYLPYIVEAIAQIKNITPEAVARQTFENAATLFGCGPAH